MVGQAEGLVGWLVSTPGRRSSRSGSSFTLLPLCETPCSGTRIKPMPSRFDQRGCQGKRVCHYDPARAGPDNVPPCDQSNSLHDQSDSLWDQSNAQHSKSKFAA